jgi:hypothetical protein
MTRLARMVPSLPRPATQRGNRREMIFFEDGDQEIYCDLFGGAGPQSGLTARNKSPRPELFHPKANLYIRINSRFRPGAASRQQSPSRQLPVVWAKARARIVRVSPIR